MAKCIKVQNKLKQKKSQWFNDACKSYRNHSCMRNGSLKTNPRKTIELTFYNKEVNMLNDNVMLNINIKIQKNLNCLIYVNKF